MPTAFSGKAVENSGSIGVEVAVFSFDKDWRSMALDIHLSTANGTAGPAARVLYVRISISALLSHVWRYSMWRIRVFLTVFSASIYLNIIYQSPLLRAHNLDTVSSATFDGRCTLVSPPVPWLWCWWPCAGHCLQIDHSTAKRFEREPSRGGLGLQ